MRGIRMYVWLHIDAPLMRIESISTGKPNRYPTEDLFFMLVWTESLKMAPTHSSHTAGLFSRGTTNTIQKWTSTPPLLLLLGEKKIKSLSQKEGVVKLNSKYTTIKDNNSCTWGLKWQPACRVWPLRTSCTHCSPASAAETSNYQADFLRSCGQQGPWSE